MGRKGCVKHSPRNLIQTGYGKTQPQTAESCGAPEKVELKKCRLICELDNT